MSVLDRIKGALAPVVVGSGGLPATGLSTMSRGTDFYELLAQAGVAGGLPALSERTAYMVPSIYGCTSLIAGAIASLSLPIYKLDAEDNPERIKHDYWWLLNEQMHPRWTAPAGWEFAVASYLLRGDGYVRIHRNRFDGRVLALEPTHPARVTPLVWDDGSRLSYRIEAEVSPDGRTIGKTEAVDQADMLHFSGFGFDGTRSLSPLGVALRVPGAVALSAQEYSARFFANGARPDFVFSTEGNVSVDKLQELAEMWEERHTGVGNSRKPGWVSNGLKVQPLTLTNEDAELLDTRKFSVEEICRIFGVPPFMVGHNEKTTSWGSGVEAMGTGFVRYTLRPHLSRIKAELNRKLFLKAGTYAEHLTESLESGDLKSRNESARMSLGRAGEPGWRTVNEVRRTFGLKPIAGTEGDQLYKGDKGTPAAPKTEDPPADPPAAS